MKFSLITLLFFISIQNILGQSIDLDSLINKEGLFYKNNSLYSGRFHHKFETCRYDGNLSQESKLQEEGEMINGKKEGKFFFKNTKGEIIGGGNYLNNKKEGNWIDVIAKSGGGDCGLLFWTFSGNYHLGEKEGFWKEQSAWKNFSEGKYLNGKKEGFWTIISFTSRVYINELMKEEGIFLNGKRNGEWKSYYYNVEDDQYRYGKLAEIINYNNDSLDGNYIFYLYHYNKPIREICAKGQFKNNKKEGTWETNAFGKKEGVRYVEQYRNDKKDMLCIYYYGKRAAEYGGIFKVEEFYDEDKLVKRTQYKKIEHGEIYKWLEEIYDGNKVIKRT